MPVPYFCLTPPINLGRHFSILTLRYYVDVSVIKTSTEGDALTMPESFNHTIYRWLYISDDLKSYVVNLCKAQGVAGGFLTAPDSFPPWGRNCKSNLMRYVKGIGRDRGDVVILSVAEYDTWQNLIIQEFFKYTKDGVQQTYSITTAHGEYRTPLILPPQ